MPNYRRAFRPGGTFFFTLVTLRRSPFLCTKLARQVLHEAIDACRTTMPFDVDAFVLMPDHLHAIWTLPEGDGDFSGRWGRIKRSFTQAWLAADGWQGAISDSQNRNHRGGVWQRRFWEHVIRDEQDYEQHLNYVHYNPIKHGHAVCAHGWASSSFHRLAREGLYAPDWCCGCAGQIVAPPETTGLDMDGLESAFGE